MQIFVNGNATDLPEGATVTQLLELLKIGTAGTALARNETIVRKGAYADTVLQTDDRIEVITAVAGG